MDVRWPVVVAMLGVLGLPLSGHAQGRGGSVSVHTGRPAHPAGTVSTQPAPGSQRAIHRPFPSVGTIPPFPAAGSHRAIPFRSSTFGLVLFDPYWWIGPEAGIQPMVLAPEMAPAGPRLLGGLQLDVEPRRALVYVDGILAGTVDQFSGYFHHLETTAGYHVIDFMMDDYEPFTIGVTVVPNKTTTYRGFLNRASRH